MDLIDDFLLKFGIVANNMLTLLEKKRHFAVVIGDKYSNSEWIPLGFLVMQEIMKSENVILKSIMVKNMVNNSGKRNMDNLWRYRALVGGYYIFRHEYIMLFQKR